VSTDDDPILRQVAKGDREALRLMLQQYGPSVREHIDREIGPSWKSSFDADDVMQVTYLEAFLNQSSVVARTGIAFEAWLRRIAENNLRDAVKELSRKKRPHPKNRVHAAVPSEDSYVALLDVLSDGGETPSRHVARDEAAQVIQTLIRQLPADYAQVLRLHDLEGQPISDVARSMGRSPGAVYMLRSRAHDRLRTLIGHETDFFSRTS
jgi:RNA polymerase sigma-70 factor (subfamily 1)